MSSELNVDVFKNKINDITVTTFAKLKGKHSFCWNFFGNVVINIDGKKRTVLSDQVFCDACLTKAKESNCDMLFAKANVKAYSKNIATSNLLRHLKDEHKIEDTYQKPKVAPIETFFSVRRLAKTTNDNNPKKDKSQLARDLALWFARSLIPFDSVEDESMKYFFFKYNIIISDSDLPSRQNISREGLEDVYESMFSHVKTIIEQQFCGNGAITADLWTDKYRRRNYITCTFHFITKEMELKKFTLATKQVTEKHTGEIIKNEIQEILQDFQIESSNVVLVTDAGSNMKKAATLLNMENHLCLGHALHNLVTVDGIQATEEINDIVNKCKKIVKHIRYRAPQLEAQATMEHREVLLNIDTIGEQLECPDESDYINEPQSQSTGTLSAPPTLKTSTPTRWHSLLTMLSSLNHRANRRPINDILRNIGLNNIKLDDHEHKLIAELICFLEKIKKVVEILCSETVTTLNLVLIFKSELRELLEEISDIEPIVLTRLKNNMLIKLEHRFPTNDTAIAACLLDCRFHGIGAVDHYMENMSTTKVSFLTNMVEKYGVNRQAKAIKNSDIVLTSTAEQGPSNYYKTASTTNFLANLAQKHNIQKDSQTAVETECWKYFSTASALDLDPFNGNVLGFWKDRQTMFPYLSALARAILFIPATSTPSERVFSVTGQVITSKRSRLNPIRINRIIFIHDNYHHCKKEKS